MHRSQPSAKAKRDTVITGLLTVAMECTHTHSHTRLKAIMQVHLAYLRAGADILMANTYNVSATRATHQGIAEGSAAASAELEHLSRNVLLAKAAIAQHIEENPSAPHPLLAASMGAYSTAIPTRAETVSPRNLRPMSIVLLGESVCSCVSLLAACCTECTLMDTCPPGVFAHTICAPQWAWLHTCPSKGMVAYVPLMGACSSARSLCNEFFCC